jgi:hypothetical protein
MKFTSNKSSMTTMKLTTLSKDNPAKKLFNSELAVEYQQIEQHSAVRDILTTSFNQELKQNRNYNNDSISN